MKRLATAWVAVGFALALADGVDGGPNVGAERAHPRRTAAAPSESRGAGKLSSSDSEDSAAKSAADSASVLLTQGAVLALARESGPARVVYRRNPGVALQPPSCFSSTIDASNQTETMVFNDCAGPRGLTRISGTIVATNVSAASGRQTRYLATGLQVSQSSLDLEATVVRTNGNGERSMTIESDTSGVGPLGDTVTTSGTYTVSWTDSCRTIVGSNQRNAGARMRSGQTDIKQCGSACSTGTISRTGPDGQTMTDTFDGSSVARWSTGARSGTLNLTCMPGG